MAPPHATRKPSNSTSRVSTRGGHCESRRRIAEQVEDEMDEANEEAEEMDIDEVEAEAVEPEDSQGAGDSKLQQLMVDMVDAQRRRHQVRKQGVYKSYTRCHTDAQEAITSLFDEHEKKAAQAYDAQISRLQSLLKQKAAIEAAMSEKLVNLRKDYIQQSKALEKVVEYRIRELR